MLWNVVLQKLTDVSEVLAASSITAITLSMKVTDTSETSRNFTRLHDATTKKAVIFNMHLVSRVQNK
jgi:hypothetical protein